MEDICGDGRVGACGGTSWCETAPIQDTGIAYLTENVVDFKEAVSSIDYCLSASMV